MIITKLKILLDVCLLLMLVPNALASENQLWKSQECLWLKKKKAIVPSHKVSHLLFIILT